MKEKGCSPGRQVFVSFSELHLVLSSIITAQPGMQGPSCFFFSNKIKRSPLSFFHSEDNHEIHSVLGMDVQERSKENSIHNHGDPTAIRYFGTVHQAPSFSKCVPTCTFLHHEGKDSIREWMTAYHMLYQIQYCRG